MSSDEETVVVAKKVQDKNSKKAGKAEKSTPAVDFQIKPAKGGPSLDTSSWPLLLKVRLPNHLHGPLHLSMTYPLS